MKTCGHQRSLARSKRCLDSQEFLDTLSVEETDNEKQTCPKVNYSPEFIEANAKNCPSDQCEYGQKSAVSEAMYQENQRKDLEDTRDSQEGKVPKEVRNELEDNLTKDSVDRDHDKNSSKDGKKHLSAISRYRNVIEMIDNNDDCLKQHFDSEDTFDNKFLQQKSDVAEKQRDHAFCNKEEYQKRTHRYERMLTNSDKNVEANCQKVRDMKDQHEISDRYSNYRGSVQHCDAFEPKSQHTVKIPSSDRRQSADFQHERSSEKHIKDRPNVIVTRADIHVSADDQKNKLEQEPEGVRPIHLDTLHNNSHMKGSHSNSVHKKDFVDRNAIKETGKRSKMYKSAYNLSRSSNDGDRLSSGQQKDAIHHFAYTPTLIHNGEAYKYQPMESGEEIDDFFGPNSMYNFDSRKNSGARSTIFMAVSASDTSFKMEQEFSKPQHKMGDFQHSELRKLSITARVYSSKDGPISLSETYGSLDRSHENHIPSQSTYQTSKSMTSLPNSTASPSRQTTPSIEPSAQSVVNGQKVDMATMKFEWLKNLSEDKLLVKIKEIIDHLKKLDDYCLGDGMHIQKMLGDMYWDYVDIREILGDCMADNGYADVSMSMLKSLNNIGIFKNNNVWFPTYYTYNTMWNFTDSSSKLATSFSENDAVRLLTLNCGHKPYLNALHSKNVFYVIKASLSILHNIARNSGMKHLFIKNKTSKTIKPFLESEDDTLKILATLTIANIIDEEENKALIADTGAIKCIVDWIGQAVSSPQRQFKGFTPQELTEGLNKLAVNDTNKMKVIDEGGLQCFIQMLQAFDAQEQSSAACLIWTVAFDNAVRKKLLDNQELIMVLTKLSESINKSVLTNSTGALWVIKGKNEVSGESIKQSAEGKNHVFLSYSWSDREEVLKIRDRLRAEGFTIWIDVEKMGGSTLEAMADAVENAAVVLMCVSEKYKQSPNCRTEAEYTYRLKKDFIPLLMQSKYKADGWLGLMMGTRFFYDFSGKDPFEKSFVGLEKELRERRKGPSNTSTPVSNVNRTPLNSFVLTMGQEELTKWLWDIKLTKCVPAFHEFDGRLLMQLKEIKSKAPEYFYQCLEHHLKMSLIEILKFTHALEELN